MLFSLSKPEPRIKYVVSIADRNSQLQVLIHMYVRLFFNRVKHY